MCCYQDAGKSHFLGMALPVRREDADSDATRDGGQILGEMQKSGGRQSLESRLIHGKRGSKMDHDEAVTKIVTRQNSNGILRSRESGTVEFKQSFNKKNIAAYAKTMAAFANNSGGYIIFGVADSPRRMVGLRNNNFEELKQERFTEAVNSLFAPAIEWDMGKVSVEQLEKDDQGVTITRHMNIGWIYVYESIFKPVIAQKDNNSENITAGDVFYRYRARNGKIKPSEMERIIGNRIARERENLLKVFEVIRKSGTANLGIVNYSSGKFTTPYGVDIAFDQKLVKQVLKKAKYIKEGSFNETEGIPVIKVTGNIDLAEEVPVPEGNPDVTHPYIQRQLAEKLHIKRQELYALIWYYKMKESKKYHLEITTSKSSKVHKFSNFALEFLQAKVSELNSDEAEFDRIRLAYKNRKK